MEQKHDHSGHSHGNLRLEEIQADDPETASEALDAFVEHMRQAPVALVPELANEQHYELPAEFFSEVLGPRGKYSCCYWPRGVNTLAESEEAMLRLARERPRLGIVADQVGCPTWARNIAGVTTRVVRQMNDKAGETRRHGTWHYCDSGVVSWYDFARVIFDTARSIGLLDDAPETDALTSAQYPQAAVRPSYSVLDTSAISREFGIEPAGLEDSLKSCLEELKKHDEA